MLNWPSTMEVGHEEFDRDHRQLIAMTNLLADALQLEDADQALALAGDLISKSLQHCQRERRVLQSEGGDTQVVARSHCRVSDLAAAVRLAVAAAEFDLAARLTQMLEESLAQAIAADRRAFGAAHARVAVA